MCGSGSTLKALGAVAQAALRVSKEYQEALWGVGSGNGYSSVNVSGGKGTEVCSRKPLPRFQRWGAVGVLNISVASSQIDTAFGRQSGGSGLLSKEAWAWLRHFFRAPETCLQVCYIVAVTSGTQIGMGGLRVAGERPQK